MLNFTKEYISGQYSLLTTQEEAKQEETKIDFFNLLPREIILEIFSYLNAKELARCEQLNKKCKVLASDKALWNALPPPEGAFGKKQWEKYFGDVGKVPFLPKEIYKIFKRETHMLVLIPETVNGKPFTLVNLGELVKAPKVGHATQYRYIWDAIIKEHGHQQTTKSHWVLMTKYVIEGSRGKSYSDQQALIAELNKQTGMSYEVPNGLDATTCIFMKYISSEERLFNDESLTYTRCQEKTQGYQVTVGGYSPAGLDVRDDIVDFNVGVSALRKFF